MHYLTTLITIVALSSLVFNDASAQEIYDTYESTSADDGWDSTSVDWRGLDSSRSSHYSSPDSSRAQAAAARSEETAEQWLGIVPHSSTWSSPPASYNSYRGKGGTASMAMRSELIRALQENGQTIMAAMLTDCSGAAVCHLASRVWSEMGPEFTGIAGLPLDSALNLNALVDWTRRAALANTFVANGVFLGESLLHAPAHWVTPGPNVIRLSSIGGQAPSIGATGAFKNATWKEIAESMTRIPPHTTFNLLGKHPAQRAIQVVSALAEREIIVAYELAPKGIHKWTTNRRLITVGDNLGASFTSQTGMGEVVIAGHAHGRRTAHPSGGDLRLFQDVRIAQKFAGAPVQTRHWVLGIEDAADILKYHQSGVPAQASTRSIINSKTIMDTSDAARAADMVRFDSVMQAPLRFNGNW